MFFYKFKSWTVHNWLSFYYNFLREEFLCQSHFIYQRYIFSRVRQFIGEQLLLFFIKLTSSEQRSSFCLSSGYSRKVKPMHSTSYILGLQWKCVFQFSWKGENHAKMGRFSQNFVLQKFLFLHKNFHKNLTKIFAKTKNPLNLTVIRHAWYCACGVSFCHNISFWDDKKDICEVMIEFRCH
jgi:hypothetical protein